MLVSTEKLIQGEVYPPNSRLLIIAQGNTGFTQTGSKTLLLRLQVTGVLIVYRPQPSQGLNASIGLLNAEFYRLWRFRVFRACCQGLQYQQVKQATVHIHTIGAKAIHHGN